MGYLDNKGLERYTWNVRNKMAQNVQMTKPARLVHFCPAPETEIEPIINFKYKEILPEEGTKGPSNPSTIVGVDSILVGHIGKNVQVLNLSRGSAGNFNFETYDDGSFRITGTALASSVEELINLSPRSSELPSLVPGEKYTVSFYTDNKSLYFQAYCRNKDGNFAGLLPKNLGNGETATFIVPEYKDADRDMWIRIKIANSSTEMAVDSVCKVQIEHGEKATEFVPAISSYNEHTIQLGNTYYGGHVNTATGIMTVTHASIKVGDIPNFTYDEGYGGQWKHPVTVQPGADYNELPICTHALFKTGNDYINATDGVFRWAAAGVNKTWYWFKSSATTAEEFYAEYGDAYLVFKLQIPFEVELDPVQIKSLVSTDKYNRPINTIYTDQESVQVGWIREDFIHKSGDETIEGIKTFKNTAVGHGTNETVTDLIVRNESVERGVGGEGRSYTRVIFADAEGDIEETYAGRLGLWECVSPKENDTIGSYIQMGSYKYSQNVEDLGEHADMRVGWDAKGIPFASVPEISDDRNESADVVTRGWANSKAWNWWKTKKDSVVQFYPLQESILEPVIEFKPVETLPISGEKSPSNPSTIKGVNAINVGRAGKNLILGGPFPLGLANITYVVNADGSITFNGSSTPSGDHSYIYTFNQTLNRYSFPSFMKRGGTYRLSATCSKSINYILYQVYVSINGAVWNNPLCEVYGGQSKTFTIPENATGLACRYIIVSGKTVDNATFKAQLEYGSSETEYEKPIVDNYVIQLGSTYYGGKIDLATGIMTVTWIEKILDRSSLVAAGAGFTWNSPDKTSKRLFFRLNGSATGFPEIKNADNVICSHFRRFDSNTLQEQSDLIFGTFKCQNDSDKWCMFYDNDMVVCDDTKTVYENKELFVDWFEAKKQGGDPVYLVYELKEPQTIQLTSTQILSLTQNDKYTPRLNTFYTDAASVQVGYQRYVNEDNFVDKESSISEEEIDEAFAE